MTDDDKKEKKYDDEKDLETPPDDKKDLFKEDLPDDEKEGNSPEGAPTAATEIGGVSDTADAPEVVDAHAVDEAELEANFRHRLKSELGTAVEVGTAESTKPAPAQEQGISNTTKFLVAAFLLSGIAVGAILGTVYSDAKKQGTASDSENSAHEGDSATPPTSHDSYFPTLMEYLQFLLTPLSGEEALRNETSPQYQAMYFLAEEDDIDWNIFDPSNELDVIERYVMMTLFYATDGPNSWNDTLLFGSNYTTCEWPNIGQDENNTYTFNEVDCDENNRIVKVRLDRNGLNGYLPSELALLPSIEIYSFGGNPDLSGTMPTELGLLSDTLNFFQTSGSSLTGTLPTEMVHLSNLEVLALYQNKFTGTVPDMTKLTALQAFDLAENSLVGNLPSLHPDAPTQVLYLEGNAFSGTIPSSYFQKTTLETISISNNQLTGTISSEIANLDALQNFWADGNLFEGSIPTEVGNMQALAWLWLFNNPAITGSIPSELANLRMMSWLDLSNMGLTGTLPPELEGLDQLRFFDIFSNDLTGTVPMSYINMVSLERFRVQNTSLTGGIEESFCALEKLTTSIGADCGGTSTVEVPCSCCTDCCQDMKGADDGTEEGNCQVNLDGVCRTNAGRFEMDLERNTTCVCLDGGTRLECTDQECPSCNLAGDVCALNTKYGYDFNASTGDITSFHNTFEYVSGHEGTVIEMVVPNEGKCFVSLNGQECRSCGGIVCASGFEGWAVLCDNIEGGGNHNICEEFVNPGPLEILSTYDQGQLTGCPLLIERVGI